MELNDITGNLFSAERKIPIIILQMRMKCTESDIILRKKNCTVQRTGDFRSDGEQRNSKSKLVTWTNSNKCKKFFNMNKRDFVWLRNKAVYTEQYSVKHLSLIVIHATEPVFLFVARHQHIRKWQIIDWNFIPIPGTVYKMAPQIISCLVHCGNHLYEPSL